MTKHKAKNVKFTIDGKNMFDNQPDDMSLPAKLANTRVTPWPEPAPMLKLSDFAIGQQPPPPYMRDIIDGIEGKRKWLNPPYEPTKQPGRLVTLSSSNALGTDCKPHRIVVDDYFNVMKHKPIPRPSLKELLLQFCKHHPNLSRKNNLINFHPYYEDEINKFWRLLLKSTPMQPNGNGLKFYASMNVFDDYFKGIKND